MSKKLTIKEMQGIAKNRSGKCISKEYINKNTKLEWECSNGHRWLATPDSVKNAGRWCPICGGSTPLTLNEIKKIAEERGGKCLSEEYTNSKSPMKWECEEGHQWINSAGKIKQGQWCPYCAGKAKFNIKELKKIAVEKGGKCLSKEYINDSPAKTSIIV